jgi:hypothetical protein
MQMQKVKAGVSLVTIIASLGFLLFRFFGPAPGIDARSHVGIGNVLAEQASKALGKGGHITLIAPDTTVFRWPGPEVQLKAFHRALRKANLAVSFTNLVKLDPGRLVHVNPEDFINVLRKQSDADVVVSLLGPPTPTAEQRGKLNSKHGRVIAVCAGDMPKQINLSALFDDGLLNAAIVSRPAPTIGSPETSDPKLWFDHFYEVVTSKSALESLWPSRAP